jgi:tRNA pseudouridine55 synthase
VQGFVNLNKPAGMTSHDCVARVRRLLRTKRVGHGGTLDPAATGVLPIAVGKATRLLPYLPTGKAYRGTVRFGVTTATDDLEGTVISQNPVPALSRDAVEAVLGRFVGAIEQIPPAYSAIQVNGKRLYQLARAGEAVEVPARRVEIYRIALSDWRGGDYPEAVLDIECGPGTYIRAIARDLGEILATGGTLAALTRTQSCGFALADSVTFEEMETACDRGTFTPIAPDKALAHLSKVSLSPEFARRWCQGQRVPLPPASGNCPPPVCVDRDDGEFLGIAEITESEGDRCLVPKMVFLPEG